MGLIRNTLGALTLSIALASGCGLFQPNPEEAEKAEKAKNRNSCLKECEKRLDGYKKMAGLYDDKGFLKSLEGLKWCSKERYDKHDDMRELRELARMKSVSFCNYWFNEALKSSERNDDRAGKLFLRKLKLNPEQICAENTKRNYEYGSLYRHYAKGI